MPRTLSTALQNQVSADATKIAFLVELQLSTIVRATNYSRDVVYNSNTYTAGGSFVTVDATTESGKLEVDEINIGLSNVTSQVRALVESGAYTDKTANIYIAYFDTNEDLVGVITYFTGQIRNVSILENIDSSNISMTVASHWANWNLTKGRHYSDASQQDFSTGDKGLRICYTG
jgi:hypothetical protein